MIMCEKNSYANKKKYIVDISLSLRKENFIIS